jgi:hypothetical protein
VILLRTFLNISVACALITLCALPSRVLAESAAPAPAPLFAADEVLHVRLRAPLAELLRLRDVDTEYPATVIVERSADDTGAALGTEPALFDAKISPRGNFRLQTNTCEFAQLWVNLKKSQLDDTLFAGQNRIKLTVQCRGFKRYEDYLLREEQAYRMLRTLTPLSLATRRLRLTLEFTESGDEETLWAFFSQHHSKLADQHELERLRTSDRLPVASLDSSYRNLINLFQYMIGNTDYSLLRGKPGDDCCHNSKPLRDAQGRIFSVPYDFDSSGYVDASYAQPAEILEQRSVRQRIYRGFCVEPAVLQQNLQRFREQRAAILAISAETAHVSARSARRGQRYIEEFFDLLEDERAVQRIFVDGCRRGD